MGFDAMAPMRVLRLATWLGLAVAMLVLHGCATTAPQHATPEGPPGATPAPPATPGSASKSAPAAAPRASALSIERQWLQSWFEGTPVRIVQQEADAMSVDVPLEFCFDAGKSKPKPPLAAVLDKVAQSLLRRPNLRLDSLAAPGDGPASPLAQQRGNQVRAHLLARGVPARQLADPSVTAAAAVQLRIESVAP